MVMVVVEVCSSSSLCCVVVIVVVGGCQRLSVFRSFAFLVWPSFVCEASPYYTVRLGLNFS